MNIREWTDTFVKSEFAELLGWVLLNSLWQIAIIATAYFCFRLMIQSPKLRYLGGVVMMAVVVFAFVGTWAYMANQNGFGHQSIAESLTRAGSGERHSSNEVKETEPLAEDDLANHAITSSLNPSAATKRINPMTGVSPAIGGLNSSTEMAAQRRSGWISSARVALPYLVLIWALGMVLFAFRPILGFVFAFRIRKRQSGEVSKELRMRLSGLAEELGLKRSVRLIQSAMIQVPMVVGYFRPIIVLPLSVVTQFSTAEIDAILRHELAHIRRHDALINVFQSLIETVFFFHPCVWWLSNQIRVERENCCDDAATTDPGNRIHLANALFRLEESRVLPQAVAANGGDLQARIKRLVVKKNRMASRFLSIRLPGLIAAATVVFVISLTAIASHPTASQPAEEFGPAKTITIQSVGDSFAWKVLKISEAKLVSQIESHFPDYHSSARGADPAGYEIDLQLSFRDESGSKVVVGLNSKLGLWSRGNGDFLMARRLDFLKAVEEHAKSNRKQLSAGQEKKKQGPALRSTVKVKGTNRPLEVEFDENTKTIIYRGSKKAVEDFGKILQKHSETKQQNQKLEPDRSDEAQFNILKNRLLRAKEALKHSRMLHGKGFMTENQVLADEYQVKVLEAQLEWHQKDELRKAASAQSRNEEARKQFEIEKQIQQSRISVAESELQLAVEEYERIKKLTERRAAPQSQLAKAKLELDRNRSQLSILRLELDRLELKRKNGSTLDATMNEDPTRVKTPPNSAIENASQFDLKILTAEIDYAKSALQVAAEKRNRMVELARKTGGRGLQLGEAELAVKRLEADLRILELKLERAKTSRAPRDPASSHSSRSVRSPEIVRIELDYAKDLLQMASEQVELTKQLNIPENSKHMRVFDALEKKVLAEKNVRVLQLELDSLSKPRKINALR